jgi:hypothetical protein
MSDGFRDLGKCTIPGLAIETSSRKVGGLYSLRVRVVHVNKFLFRIKLEHLTPAYQIINEGLKDVDWTCSVNDLRKEEPQLKMLINRLKETLYLTC